MNFFYTSGPDYSMIFLMFQGFGIAEEKRSIKVPFIYESQEYTLSHGSVVIAAVTSCTNTSNPSVMLGAGRSICESRIHVKSWFCCHSGCN